MHGLTAADLHDQPVFADLAARFLKFIANDRLIIHNAEFDLRFLNAELLRVGLDPIELDRSVDTVKIARQKFPGSPASLDALCRKFSINNSMFSHLLCAADTFGRSQLVQALEVDIRRRVNNLQ